MKTAGPAFLALLAGLDIVSSAYFGSSYASPPRPDNLCNYICTDGGGCEAHYIGPPRRGNIKGSCFPDSFGGRCSGTPRECQDCNQAITCKEPSRTPGSTDYSEPANPPPSQARQCTTGGNSCIFPFLYKGREFHSCTTFDSANGKAWCATSVNQGGNVYGGWEDCARCAGNPTFPRRTPHKEPSQTPDYPDSPGYADPPSYPTLPDYHSVCEVVYEEQCGQVAREVCGSSSYGTAKGESCVVYDNICNKVPREVCHQVPRKNQPKCEDVLSEVCEQVPYQHCVSSSYGEESCHTHYDEECKTVVEQECETIW
jgi:hypothetical protein